MTGRSFHYFQEAGSSDDAIRTQPDAAAGLVAWHRPADLTWTCGRSGSDFCNWDDSSTYGDDFTTTRATGVVAGNTLNGNTTAYFEQGTDAHVQNSAIDGGTGTHLTIGSAWGYAGGPPLVPVSFFTTFIVLVDRGSTNTDERHLFGGHTGDPHDFPSDTSLQGVWLTLQYNSSKLRAKYAIRSSASDISQSTIDSSAPPILTSGTVLCLMQGARSIDGGSSWTRAIRLASLVGYSGEATTAGTPWNIVGTWDANITSGLGATGTKMYLGGCATAGLAGTNDDKACGCDIPEYAMYSSKSGDSDEIVEYSAGDYKYAFAGCTAPDHGSSHATRTADRIGNWFRYTYDLD